MRTLALTIAAVLLLGTGLAQGDGEARVFPDVRPGHWAEEEVARMARAGIIVGFPDGTFRGDDRLSRYEAALLVDRLLRVAGLPLASPTDALGGLDGRVDRLRSRLDGLEGRPGTRGADALQDRVAELEDEVDRLRAELGLPPRDREDAMAGAPGAGGDAGAVGPAVDGAVGGAAGPAGPRGGAGAAGADADGTVGEGAGAAFSADGYLAADHPWHVTATIGLAPDGAPTRLAIGHDALLGPAGLRASLDVLWDEGGVGDAALSTHVTWRFGAGRWSGYVGAGPGFRYDADVSPTEGVFVGALIGGEYAIDERWGLVFEGTIDYHLTAVGVEAPEGSAARPSLAIGASYRF